MGTQPPTRPVRPFSRRVTGFALAAVLPLTLVTLAAAPALADEPPAAVQPATDIPDSQIHIGTVQLEQPVWLTAEQTQQINAASAGAETALTQSLEAAGLDPARATHIAKAVIGDAAVGAAVGATAAAPIASTGAVIGVVSGLIAGLPFAPIGLVIVPVVGAALGYAMVAAPFAALGAGVGAAVGAVDGATGPIPGTNTP
ncbi:hypothetical protein D7D52_32525 [Nocardia yunnanensis]|uniref:Uncharacterized protein n=1 Tax=Nocardia yunnanensis TaxID=2382165 RepID=A0A386ZK15_9NOCA|nr:hypothetical protein [Nocardia yunnanensis]AYF77758.1 hypothetical protein D7D52_32525 [Nocardia yunnanensis]